LGRRAGLALGSLLLVAAGGCRTAAVVTPPATVRPPSYAGLDAALWVQTAEEARLLRVTAYVAATAALERGLADPIWSALDQGPGAAALPAAAILDLDETVLDNSAYEAYLVRAGRSFEPASWSAWVATAEAKAIPGVLDFARRAAELGITLYFVSNRDAPMEQATRANLAALGLPLPAGGDVVLLRGERPEWRSDKRGRYEEIAARHRVLVLVGDDLNDFLSGAREATLAERRALAEPHAGRFGRDWFLLPNPMHGSWLRAASAGAGGGGEIERRLERLEAFDGPAPPP